MSNTFKVRSASRGLLSVNLDEKDEKGIRKALYLAPGETSRELSETEFRSAELQKLVGKRVLCDVTGFAERQRLAREAAGQPS